MKKYKLIKEIPNCDWKVGEIVETDIFNDLHYIHIATKYDSVKNVVPPHQIALLIHCGFLEEVKEEKYIYEGERYPGAILKGRLRKEEELVLEKGEVLHYDFDKKEITTINRFTEMPPEGTEYFWHTYSGFIKSDIMEEDFTEDLYRFRTGNCYRTEEACRKAYEEIMKSE